MGLLSSIFRFRDKPRNLGGGATFWLGQSSAGKVVTEQTAMQMTAVYACVRILSEAIAGLPLHLYQFGDDGREPRADESTIGIIGACVKKGGAELFAQIVGRVNDDEVGKMVRDVFNHVEQVGTERRIDKRSGQPVCRK